MRRLQRLDVDADDFQSAGESAESELADLCG
jgi:hypothetical protein